MAPRSAIIPIDLRTPIQGFDGVGATTTLQFARLGLQTVGDLLKHIPIRYEVEAAEACATEVMHATEASQDAITRSIRGEIQKVRHIPGGRPRIEAVLVDESGSVRLVWFNASWLAKRIHPGARGIAQGRAKVRAGYLEMTNPKWTPLTDERDSPMQHGRLRPIYPASEDLASARIERVIARVLDGATASVVDLVRSEVLAARGVVALPDAYRMVHAPVDALEHERGRRRLAYDELLMLQLAMEMRRWQVRHAMRAPALAMTAEIEGKILARIPFELTAEQLRVCREIGGDLATTHPMNRLLQGDVGSGKTAVALYAMLTAVAHGAQAALLAPTEILAEQHLEVITKMLAETRVRIAGVTGGMRVADRAVVRQGLASGAFDIAVGTHALMGADITFKNLALTIIDEQHRFGVEQRAALRAKGPQGDAVPHTLVMTATPIPRTLALSFFGDLDISSLRGRLPGRTAATTRVMPSSRAAEVYAWLRSRIQRGEQAFVVVPAIDESQRGLKDVASHAQALRENELQGYRVGQLHGRMKQSESEGVMDEFRLGKIDVLVATVVIEVGVDVSNATVMVVEHAEQFGLAQLHQLRGRVGRGGKPGYCVLIGDPTSDVARARLDAIAHSSDGFEIAELDLALRGPGEFFGARQSGLPPLRIADFVRDHQLLVDARADAQAWIGATGDLTDACDLALRTKVLRLYGEALGLGDIG